MDQQFGTMPLIPVNCAYTQETGESGSKHIPTLHLGPGGCRKCLPKSSVQFLLPASSISAAISRTDVKTALLLQNKTIYFLAIPADATTFSRNPVC